MKIFSIFNSIDGEVNKFHQGAFSTFIRFSGCNFKCNFCDTLYAIKKEQGSEMTVKEVLLEVEKIGCKKVTITGGEPLFQREELGFLLEEFDRSGYQVSIETNGSFPPFLFRTKNAFYVMDWKLPSSGMENQMNIENFVLLTERDFIKFVIGDREDFKRALEVKQALQDRGGKGFIAFSPVVPQLNPAILVEWCQESKVFDVVINLQLHKYIWPDIGEGKER